MLSTRNDEKDALREQVEHLKQDLNAVENELDVAMRRIERREGKRSVEGEEMSREELERVSFRISLLALSLPEVEECSRNTGT